MQSNDMTIIDLTMCIDPVDFLVIFSFACRGQLLQAVCSGRRVRGTVVLCFVLFCVVLQGWNVTYVDHKIERHSYCTQLFLKLLSDVRNTCSKYCSYTCFSGLHHPAFNLATGGVRGQRGCQRGS